MIIEALITRIKKKKVAVAFIDNTDFITNKEIAQQKMQQILDTYNEFYTATGGFIEYKKTKFYSQKCKQKQGQK